MSKRKTTVFVLLLAVVLLAAFAAFKLYRDRRASFPLTYREQVEALSFRRPFFHDIRTNDVGQRLAFCVSCKGLLLQFVPPTEQEAAYAVTREGAIAEVPQELFDFLDQLSP